MPLPFIFANLGTGAPVSDLDSNFSAVALLTTIPCTVSGTNTLTLTPFSTNTPTVGGYQNYIVFTGIAANANSGAVTASVGGLAALSVYKDTSSGPVALTGGEIQQNNRIVLSFDSTLSSGAGGFHLVNALVGGAPSGTAGGDLSGTYPNPTVAKINGVALGVTTASAGRLLVANGTNWPSVAMSGDATLASSGAITVTKTSGTALTGAATATYVTPTSWTPADGSGAGLTFTGVNAEYTRIGNMVFAHARITYPVTADTSHAILSGLPVAVPNQTYAACPAACYVSGGSISVILLPIISGSTAGFQNMAGGANVTNANLSGLSINFILVYPAA